MIPSSDGPASNLFSPLRYDARWVMEDLVSSDLISSQMAEVCALAPKTPSVSWGIPFDQSRVICVAKEPTYIDIQPQQARWLVFLHTADLRALETNASGFFSPMMGEGGLSEPLARYVFLFDDGTEEQVIIRGRHQIGAYTHRWGELCFQAVPVHKPYPLRASHEQTSPIWGQQFPSCCSETSRSWRGQRILGPN